MNEYDFENRIELFCPERPGCVVSYIKVFQTKARNDLILKLNTTIKELQNGIIHLNGPYGVGKSYSLANFVVKSRVQTQKELENRNPNQPLHLFMYAYLNRKFEKEYIYHFRTDLLYACYPLIKNELDYILNRDSNQNSNIDYESLFDKKSLINLLFSLFKFTNKKLIPEIFNEILDVLEVKYNARLVVVFDQINEIKRKSENTNKNKIQECLLESI